MRASSSEDYIKEMFISTISTISKEFKETLSQYS